MSLAKLWAMYTSLEQGRKGGSAGGMECTTIGDDGRISCIRMAGTRRQYCIVGYGDQAEAFRTLHGAFTGIGGLGKYPLCVSLDGFFFPPLEVWEWLFRHFGSMSERERRGEVYTIQ